MEKNENIVVSEEQEIIFKERMRGDFVVEMEF
jgi:hypothetical protein